MTVTWSWLPWRRRRQRQTPRSDDAAKAKAEAERKLDDTVEQSREVREVAKRLDKLHRRNHIADAIERALRRS